MNEFELDYYKRGYRFVIGCDEVGRGSLAGPVVAAAVVLNPKHVKKIFNAPLWYREIKDSKQLKPRDRQRLSDLIIQYSLGWAVAEVAPETIDEVNIHWATLMAMRQAVKKVFPFRDSHATEKNFLVAVDGKFVIQGLGLQQEAVVRGDQLLLSIAAASIVAKVHRDARMVELEKKFPEYGFAQHKGYATAMHRQAIKEHGPSLVHRISFLKHI